MQYTSIQLSISYDYTASLARFSYRTIITWRVNYKYLKIVADYVRTNLD